MASEIPTDPPNRSRPIHQPVIDARGRAAIVFLTVCTKGRQPVLATPSMHQSLKAAWAAAGDWQVGRYVIMPDHLHLFCAPGVHPPESLQSWISYWKRLATQAHGSQLWQRDFWDTQLRHQDCYALKWEYVRNNPVRAGLTASADAWPFQGELNVLRWHD